MAVKKLFVATNLAPAPSQELRDKIMDATSRLNKGWLHRWSVLHSFAPDPEHDNPVEHRLHYGRLAIEVSDVFVGILEEPGDGLGALALHAHEEAGIPIVIMTPAAASVPDLAMEGPYFYPDVNFVRYRDLATELPEALKNPIPPMQRLAGFVR